MNFNYRYSLLWVVPCLLFSCKDDGNGDVPTPGSSSEKQQVIDQYNSVFKATEVTSFPWNGDAASCKPGTMDSDIQAKTLQRVNYFRGLAGLSTDITFRDDWNQKCMQAALMCHANNALNHTPPSSWSCYTEGGREAALKSNLSATPSTQAIISYMRDAGAGNIDVGHRRWILYSRGKTMGHGATSRYDALWVSGGSSMPSNMLDYIAWPPKYVPSPFVWPRWSFSVPLGNFANAKVKVTSNGSEIPATIISRAANFGDPTLVFEPQGIDATTDGKTYTVEVSGVMVGGETKSYTHTTTIVKVD